MPPPPPHLDSSPGLRLFRRLTGIEESEARNAIFAFLYFFCVLAGYFVLQPFRDEIGQLVGEEITPRLIRWSLVVMFIANPIFSYLVNHFSRVRFISLVYRFFALNLLLFIGAFHYLEATGHLNEKGAAQELTGFALLLPAVFFVWVGVFNLFATSVFWVLMADLYDGSRSKKIFGFVGAGGTLGQMFGSALTHQLVSLIGTTNTLFISMVLLELGVRAMFELTRDYQEPKPEKPESVRSGSRGEQAGAFSGIKDILKSPYLLTICLYLFLYSFTSMILWFQKQEIVAATFTDRTEKLEFFAAVNFAVSFGTVIIQLFLTGRILPLIGLKAGLALVPTVTVLGFLYLSKFPTLMALAVFEVVRKTANYSISRPSREVLFTAVSRREKYLSKSFIDTFVYRAGDAGASYAFEGLKAASAGFTLISFAAVPCAVLWLGVGVGLGAAHQRKMETTADART